MIYLWNPNNDALLYDNKEMPEEELAYLESKGYKKISKEQYEEEYYRIWNMATEKYY